MIFIVLKICVLAKLLYAKNILVQNQKILYNDDLLNIKGFNWYGFETKSSCIEGLWENPIDFYLDTMHNEHFNMIRVPIHAKMILNENIRPSSYELVKKEPLAINKTSIQILDLVVQKAKEYSMFVLIDIHRLIPGVSYPLWYTETLTEHNYLFVCIDLLLQRYSETENVIGIDLYNEPHYQASYDTGDRTDWKLFIERAVYEFFPRYQNTLFFINGIDWGKNLTLVGRSPPNIPLEYMNRIVWSPHLYGPSITNFRSLEKKDLYPIWDALFGYLRFDSQFCIVIGEWGTKFKTPDGYKWIHQFLDYMQDRQFHDNLFWSLNPYSKDVDGILSEWNTFDQNILDFLSRAQPSPTFLSFP